MSREEKRAEGDTSWFDFRWRNKDGTPVDISIPGQFTSIDLVLERIGEALVTLPIVVDDGPNGLGHFVPSASHITPGAHKYRVVAVSAATGETIKRPSDAPVRLIVSPALVSNP